MKNYQQKAVPEDPIQPKVEPAPVTAYMTRAKDLITFRPDMEIREVVKTLLKHEITGAPVLDERGALVGLIDDKDCLQVLFDSSYHNRPTEKNTVTHFMTNVMKTISDKADIYVVADVFLKTIYKRLLVVDEDGKLMGQISRQDILRAIHDSEAY